MRGLTLKFMALLLAGGFALTMTDTADAGWRSRARRYARGSYRSRSSYYSPRSYSRYNYGRSYYPRSRTYYRSGYQPYGYSRYGYGYGGSGYRSGYRRGGIYIGF